MREYNSMISNLPHIRKIINSEQFPYSERIMALRYELDLDIETLAEIAELDLKDYVSLEYSDTTIPVEEYIKAIDKLEEYKAKR